MHQPFRVHAETIATSNIMKFVQWPLMGKQLHLVYSERGLGGAAARPVPSRCTKCNSQPINGQSIPITVLPCGFNVHL